MAATTFDSREVELLISIHLFSAVQFLPRHLTSRMARKLRFMGRLTYVLLMLFLCVEFDGSKVVSILAQLRCVQMILQLNCVIFRKGAANKMVTND